MNKILQKLVLAILCLVMNCQCFSAESARLFMMRKGEHIAFFLPVTHQASKFERDAYLPTVIEEVFRRSSTLYDESTPISHIVGFAFHPCEQDALLPLFTKEKLEKKFSEIASYDKLDYTQFQDLQFNDFGKLMVLLFGPINLDVKNLPPGMILGEQVSTTLTKKYGGNRVSIEGMHDFHRIYCALSSEEKVDTVEGMLQFSEDDKRAYEPFASRRYQRWLRSAVKSINRSKKDKGANSDVPVNELAKTKLVDFDLADRNAATKFHLIDKFILAERNDLWIEKIIKISKEPGLPFYALGAAHFVPNKFGPGLFTLLQQAGFSIELIRSMDDIPVEIKSFPSKNPVTNPLSVNAEMPQSSGSQ